MTHRIRVLLKLVVILVSLNAPAPNSLEKSTVTPIEFDSTIVPFSDHSTLVMLALGFEDEQKKEDSPPMCDITQS